MECSLGLYLSLYTPFYGCHKTPGWYDYNKYTYLVCFHSGIQCYILNGFLAKLIKDISKVHFFQVLLKNKQQPISSTDWTILFHVSLLLALHGVVHGSHCASYYFFPQSCNKRQPKILISNKSVMETIVEVAWEINLWTESHDSLLKCNPCYREIQKPPLKRIKKAQTLDKLLSDIH